MTELLSILPFIADSAMIPDFPTPGRAVLYILGILFFLLMNAFFVASEFALVKVRPSQLETHGKETGAYTARAEHVVRNLDGYLAANQLGITFSTLALGSKWNFFKPSPDKAPAKSAAAAPPAPASKSRKPPSTGPAIQPRP